MAFNETNFKTALYSFIEGYKESMTTSGELVSMISIITATNANLFAYFIENSLDEEYSEESFNSIIDEFLETHGQLIVECFWRYRNLGNK